MENTCDKEQRQYNSIYEFKYSFCGFTGALFSHEELPFAFIIRKTSSDNLKDYSKAEEMSNISIHR